MFKSSISVFTKKWIIEYPTIIQKVQSVQTWTWVNSMIGKKIPAIITVVKILECYVYKTRDLIQRA